MENCTTTELFIFDNVQVFPYKHDECLVYTQRNNLKIKLGPIDIENALACDEFHTIDEHTDIIYDKLSESGQDKETIKKSLKGLLKTGLMITPKEAIANISGSSESFKSSRSWKDGWVLAICSSDRPKLVARLLSTITQHLLDLPTKPLILMIDDSRNKESSSLNFQSIHEYCEIHALEYEFWNREKRHLYAQKLSRKLPKCEVSIHYLLSPKSHSQELNTIGQARNFAVLKSNGFPLLMLDDDCLISPLQETNYKSNLNLGYSGRRAIVKASYDELFINFEKSDVNPFLEHLKVLGKSVNTYFSDKNNETDNFDYWKGRTKEAVADLERDNYIGLSVNTIVGALNSRQMGWFYSLGKQDVVAAAELLESLDEDKNLSLDQATWDGRPFDEVSRNIPFIGTTICGVSALSLVPPMPPTGRNEDLSLGATIRFLYGESRVYRFGWGLPHLPSPKRQWQPFQAQEEPSFNSTSYYISLLSEIENHCPYSNPEERLKYLTMYLRHLSDENITSYIKDTLYSHHADTINQIKNSVKHTTEYPRYQQGCMKMFDFHHAEMISINDRLPMLQPDMKSFLNLFSKALSDWSNIWAFSKQNKISVL